MGGFITTRSRPRGSGASEHGKGRLCSKGASDIDEPAIMSRTLTAYEYT